jgi:hypothetical protein
MELPRAARALLDRLEAQEMRLLTWGCTDGAFSEDEVRAAAAEAFQVTECRTADDFEVDELLAALLDRALLWGPPGGGYRSRMAEGVRLFSRLRQIFPSGNDDAWRHAATLVADYRFLRRPRAYPARDVPAREVPAKVPALERFAAGREVLRLLLVTDQEQGQTLRRFQVTATQRILHQVSAALASDHPLPSGTIVCAGTGSGKTKAFYLPALIAVGDRIQTNSFWTKTIAIYPRNELLKDQLRAALGETLRLSKTLRQIGKRPVVIGALFGDTPESGDPNHLKEWERAKAPTGSGVCCPFVRCPSCGDALVWLDTKRDAGVEHLVCFTPGCNIEVQPDEIRLTRRTLAKSPPDILFTSTELLNQRLWDSRFRHLFGVTTASKPFLLLLDEVHTYEGATGAHVAYLLRRWRRSSGARPHVVGLSATLTDATQFLADLTGIHRAGIEKVEPAESELEYRDAEYLLALRGDPSSQASLLSTSIQALMLLRRLLAKEPGDDTAGSRVFAFADNLDVVNRLYHDTLDAEGWWAPGRPKANRTLGSLANLRASDLPHEDERMSAGQNWRLVEDIGHSLSAGSRATVSRTSSQDSGVDRDSDIVVATSSLEVGVDDPDVGAVLQHKAPRSAAPFVQRKGRAGRRVGTRPWTVVTLSDFGRDRIAYQAYDQLFSPTLPPRFLPLRNRAVLRMQATYALLDWLASRCVNERVSTWRELSGPVEPREGSTTIDPADVQRQRRHIARLQSLLDDPASWRDFTVFVARQLQIPEEEAGALLWEPPRAVLLEAVPTLLRRLESNWMRIPGGADLSGDWNPLPDFLQRTLFGELLVPEVAIRIHDTAGNHTRTESMLIRQALAEFAPGRVSRRFGDRDARDRQWIDPGGGGNVSLDAFCSGADREYLGQFEYLDGSERRGVPVYRPLAVRVTQPPDNVKTASNGFPNWKTQIVRPGEGISLEFPAANPARRLLARVEVFAHVFSNPVEVRRFVPSGSSGILRGQLRTEWRWEFTIEGGNSAALGFAADVDAVAFRFAYPKDLAARCAATPRLLRALRVGRFRDLVKAAALLEGVLNSFQRDQLAEAWLAALTVRSLQTGETLEACCGTITSEEGQEAVRDALDRLHLWAEEASDLEGESDERDESRTSAARQRSLPKRLQELRRLLENPLVLQVMSEASDALWKDLDDTWEPWLRRRYRATLGAAVQVAAQDLCPRTALDAAVVDLPDDPPAEGTTTEDLFWLTETSLGGGAFVEDFQTRVAEDPRRFTRLVRAALEPSDLESIGDDLERMLTLLASDGEGDADLRSAVRQLREAADYRSRLQALGAVREGMLARGVTATRSFLVAFQTRVLGPGTSRETDAWLASAFRQWTETEDRLGIDVDFRTFALSMSEDSRLEEALHVAPEGSSDAEWAVWRHSVVRGMLWPRGGVLRSEALKVENPFSILPACDRLLVTACTADDSATIDVSQPQWFQALSAELALHGEARLSASLSAGATLAAAIRQFTVVPVEIGGIHVYGRVTGIRRDVGQWLANVELREAQQ